MKAAVTLKENRDFRRLYRKGATAVDRCMVLYCRRNHLGRNRYGFTVSTKLGKAVVRNRARRRLRETVRLEEGNLTPGWDIVVVARGRCLSRSCGRATGGSAGSSTCCGGTGNEASPHRHGEVLSEEHLPLAAALLPLHPHLLPVRPGGPGEVWGPEGELAGAAAVSPLPSLPQGRV